LPKLSAGPQSGRIDLAGPRDDRFFDPQHGQALRCRNYDPFARQMRWERLAGGPPALERLHGFRSRRYLLGHQFVFSLPHLSEMHQLQYARYLKRYVKRVALRGYFDEPLDQLIADIS
jgi:hypothetical protein